MKEILYHNANVVNIPCKFCGMPHKYGEYNPDLDGFHNKDISVEVYHMLCPNCGSYFFYIRKIEEVVRY